ncbi:MAG: GvpL/GvpF family gas vesicle protein [Bacillota bacterium]
MLYFYGIIHNPNQNPDLSQNDHNNPAWFIVEYKDIAAIVENTEQSIYLPTNESVMKHHAVMTGIMENHSIIPARFGTLFRTVKDVEIFLNKIYDYVLELLEKVDYKIELGLNAFWKEAAFEKMLDLQEINALKKEISKSEGQVAYLLTMQLGELVQAIVELQRNRYINEIHNKLAGLAFDDMVKEIVDVKMAFNYVYLIDKNQLAHFSAQVEKLTRGISRDLNISFTGPWPPYNFTTLKIDFEKT